MLKVMYYKRCATGVIQDHIVYSVIINLLTVGTYSDGNLLVVYDINRHVLPTAPSPTTTHFIVCILSVVAQSKTNKQNISDISLLCLKQT